MLARGYRPALVRFFYGDSVGKKGLTVKLLSFIVGGMLNDKEG
jgi:hypothetical protein